MVIIRHICNALFIKRNLLARTNLHYCLFSCKNKNGQKRIAFHRERVKMSSYFMCILIFQEISTTTFPNGKRVKSQTCMGCSCLHHHLTNRLPLGIRVKSQTCMGCSLVHHHLTNRLHLSLVIYILGGTTCTSTAATAMTRIMGECIFFTKPGKPSGANFLK